MYMKANITSKFNSILLSTYVGNVIILLKDTITCMPLQNSRGVVIVGGLEKVAGIAINGGAGKMSEKHSSLHTSQYTRSVFIIHSQ